MKIRKISLAFTLILHLITFCLYSQSYEPSKVQMTLAKMHFTEGNYKAALQIYDQEYKKVPKDALLNFKIGQCYFELQNFDTAFFYLNNAYKSDTSISPEIDYLLGQVYHYKGNLNKAIEHFMIYKNKLKPKENETNYVNILLQQCYTAKKNIENPVLAKIKLLNENINSKYVDANPCISADGKKIVYTSRRPENIGSSKDIETSDYFDDIYISNWDETNSSWNKSDNIGKPINTEFHDASLSITPDGNTIYLYKNIENITKSGDIYHSSIKPTGTWSEPKSIDDKFINSSYFESSASFTSDGNTIYFVSERKDSYGKADIYTSKRIGKQEWSKPVNLGSTVNSPYDEIGVFIHPDGKTLFFSSNGNKTMGGYDIFMTTLEKGKWTEPINLGYPINTTRNEVHFVLTANRKNAYISSNREGGYGAYDIYNVDMSEYFGSNKTIPGELALMLSSPPLCILKGTIIDGKTSEPISTSIIFKDLSDNEKTYEITSNQNGEYFITLNADNKVEMIINHNGYKISNSKFKLPKSENGEISTMIKHILLNKQ